MFCKNCGKELPDHVKFCNNCGSPVTPPASQQTPPAASGPVADGSVIPDPVAAENPVQPADSAGMHSPAPTWDDPGAADTQPVGSYAAPEYNAAQPGGAPADTSPFKHRGKSGVVVLGVAAVVVIVVLVLLVKLIGGLLGGGSSVGYVYLNDDGELMYLADLKEKTQPLELSDAANTYANVQFSPDGKTVYFRETDNSLYYITVASLKKGGSPERISRDVSTYTVLKDGRVLYTQYNSSDGSRLYVYDGAESTRLLRGYSTYRLSEDQKTVYYTERDDTDYTLALYRLDLTKSDAQAERLLKGANYIYTDYDASLLVYGVEDWEDGAYVITVYSCVPGGDKTKLVSDAYSVSDVTVSGGKADFYFEIREMDYGQTSVSIYHYTNGDKGSAIATEVNPYGSRVSANGIFLYHKLDDDEQWYQNVGGKESKINLDATYIYGLYLLGSKEAVLYTYDGYDEILSSYTVGSDSLTFSATILEDDIYSLYTGTVSGSDVLCLFTDVSSAAGDFRVYKGGKLETVAKEVYGAAILANSGATYVITDVNSRSGTAELALLKDGKLTTINDGISDDPIFLDSTQVLYISDEDLMLWNGKENRRIAQDVVYAWASAQEEFTGYNP